MEEEMYTFSDFCIDREILSKEMADDLRHLRVMWDIHGDDYIDYCKDNDLEFERIPMKLLTTQQAADILGINLNNISLRCRQGKIPGAVQIGGRWLIPEESLDEIKAYPEKKNKRYSPS